MKKLILFLRVAKDDNRIGATHISLYLALYVVWVENSHKNPIAIRRSEIMAAAKINSKATYHKCLSELVRFGHIEYYPSRNNKTKSSVFIFAFSDFPR